MKKLNMAEQPDVTCDRCKKDIFLSAIKLKRVSALLSPSGQETLHPLEIFVCANCGHINDEWLPKKEKDPTESASKIITK